MSKLLSLVDVFVRVQLAKARWWTYRKRISLFVLSHNPKRACVRHVTEAYSRASSTVNKTHRRFIANFHSRSDFQQTPQLLSWGGGVEKRKIYNCIYTATHNVPVYHPYVYLLSSNFLNYFFYFLLASNALSFEHPISLSIRRKTTR